MVIEPTLVEDATSHLQIIMPFTYRKSVDTGPTKNIFFMMKVELMKCGVLTHPFQSDFNVGLP